MSKSLFRPYISWRAIVAAPWHLLKVKYGRAYLAEGPVVKELEYEFAKKFYLQNVVALNSGTSALEIAYDLAGIQRGDEVIVPVLTCAATNIPLVRRGAIIRFADINGTLNLDPKDVEKKITKKTKAIVFVHFGGNPTGLAEILEIGKRRNIKIIEDAAQSVGGYFGRGDLTAVSLQAIKSLTSGDGGFLICKNRDDFERAKRLRWFGYDRERKQQLGDTDLFEAGYKFHMNDITAAIGLANLKSIDAPLRHRKKLMDIYESYGAVPGIWFSTAIVENRDFIQSWLKDMGYETGLHHFRNDKYTLFGAKRDNLSFMNWVEDKYLLLPQHHGITERDAHRIGAIIKRYAVHR